MPINGSDTTAGDTSRIRRNIPLFELETANTSPLVTPAYEQHDDATKRGDLIFSGVLRAYQLQKQYTATQNTPTNVAPVKQETPPETNLVFKVKVPDSGDPREIRDTILREQFNYTDADIVEFDRQTDNKGFWVDDTRHPERWATPDEVKSWKIEDGQTTITMSESLVRDLRTFRENRVESAPVATGDEPSATFTAADDKPQTPDALRYGGRIDKDAKPDEAAAFITERLRFSSSSNLRETQAQFFTQALKDHANDPQWMQSFLRGLGTEKSAELINAAAQPGTYQYQDEKQINERLGTVRDALARLTNAGLLNRADMDKLVGKGSENGNVNPWLATEVFAKAPSENVKNLFIAATINKALHTDGKTGNDTAAAATHVLASTSPQNQARQLTAIINAGDFDKLMLRSRAGESEIPQFVSLVKNSGSFGGRPEFEKYGRSTELLTSLRAHYAANPNARPLAILTDQELAAEYSRVLGDRSVPLARVDQVEDEFERRTNFPSGVGAASLLNLPREPGGSTPYTAANTNVTPDVAARILENVSKGEPPFKPELGKGGVSWFVSDGNPYVGVSPEKSVTVPIEVKNEAGVMRFGERELIELYNRERPEALKLAESQYRERRGLGPDEPITSKKGLNAIERNANAIAENRMWDTVAAKVKASDSGVGKVELKGSRFSKQGDGEFTIVRDAEDIRVKEGIPKLLETLRGQGVEAEPVVIEAAEALAKQQKWSGNVRGVFRVGGRVLIVVGLANDAYKIYTAKDKVKAVVESAGGWAGATAAGAAFAAWFTPADAAGPWAWAAHGVGTLIAGGVGYWAGSETTRTIYELVVEEPPK